MRRVVAAGHHRRRRGAPGGACAEGRAWKMQWSDERRAHPPTHEAGGGVVRGTGAGVVLATGGPPPRKKKKWRCEVGCRAATQHSRAFGRRAKRRRSSCAVGPPIPYTSTALVQALAAPGLCAHAPPDVCRAHLTLFFSSTRNQDGRARARAARALHLGLRLLRRRLPARLPGHARVAAHVCRVS